MKEQKHMNEERTTESRPQSDELSDPSGAS